MAVPKGWLWVLSMLFVLATACSISQGPVSVRVIVTDGQVSADGEKVEFITVRTEDGKELSLRMGEDIDPEMWRPRHLLSHVGLGKSLGLKIGVTYVQTSESAVATVLTE